MIDNDYSPADITVDAVKFARSRYGKHYIASLEESVKFNTEKAVDLSLTPRQNRDYAVRADQDKSNIQYFRTAETIAKSPNLMQKLHDAFKKRINKSENARG